MNLLRTIAILFTLSIGIYTSSFAMNTLEPVECTICLEEYTKDTIVLQLDCNQKKHHHMCLDCAKKQITTNEQICNEHHRHTNHLTCPLCRAPFRLHDPRIDRTSYQKIHHVYRPLTSKEQKDLSWVLQRVPLSKRRSPEAIDRACHACQVEHEAELLVRFTCSHAVCLNKALSWAASGSCQVCNEPLRLVDPLRGPDRIKLLYQARRPSREELTILHKLRSMVPLYQEHIPYHQRVPVSNPASLPVLSETYPNLPPTNEDKELNAAYLPAHLSPQDWQVVLQPNGTLALARRARTLPQRPQPSPKKSPSYTSSENNLGRNLLIGIACGFLIGPEFDKKGTRLRRAYPFALGFSAYSIYETSPSERLKAAGIWTIGLLGGIYGYLQRTAKN